METKEMVISQKFWSNLNLLIENTLEREQKIEEELNFFFNNNANQPKKRKHEKKQIKNKNKTIQHDKNKVTNLFY